MPQSLMINRLLIDGETDDLTVNSANQFDWLVMACADQANTGRLAGESPTLTKP